MESAKTAARHLRALIQSTRMYATSLREANPKRYFNTTTGNALALVTYAIEQANLALHTPKNTDLRGATDQAFDAAYRAAPDPLGKEETLYTLLDEIREDYRDFVWRFDREQSGQMHHDVNSGSAFMEQPDSWGDKPFCRIEWTEDKGDPSVGINPSEGWSLSADQTGTVVADISKGESNAHEIAQWRTRAQRLMSALQTLHESAKTTAEGVVIQQDVWAKTMRDATSPSDGSAETDETTQVPAPGM